jgi:hypothetical protein
VLPYQPDTRPDGQFRLQYVRNNNEPIIDVPENYVVSITQQKIPVNSLPIFNSEALFKNGDIWKSPNEATTLPQTVSIQNNIPEGANEFDTKYTVTLKYNGTSVTKIVQYKTSFNANNIFNPEYVNPRYNYVYTYTDFLEMINDALLQALNNPIDGLKILEPATSLANPPFFNFNSETQLITLYAESDCYATDEPLPFIPIEIYLNDELRRFFQAFTVKFNPNAPINLLTILNDTKYADKSETLQMLVFNKNGLNTIELGGNPYYIMTQDYNTLVLWNDVETIQFTTNLPISSEYIEQKGTNSNTTDSILRDFIIFYSNPSSANRTNLNYAVQEYNYTSLFGTTPIRNIIITGFWVSKRGERFPLFLQEGETALIKLLFRKKSTIK